MSTSFQDLYESGKYAALIEAFYELNPEQRTEFVEMACSAAYLGARDASLSATVSRSHFKNPSEVNAVLYLWMLIGEERWEDAVDMAKAQVWSAFECQAIAAVGIGHVMQHNHSEAKSAASDALHVAQNSLSVYAYIIVSYVCNPTMQMAANLIQRFRDFDGVLVRDLLLRIASYYKLYQDIEHILKQEPSQCRRTYVVFSRFIISLRDGDTANAACLYNALDSSPGIRDVAIRFSLGVYDCKRRSYGAAVEHFSSILVFVQSNSMTLVGKADYYAWYSYACIKLWRVSDALKYSETALSLDAENVLALAVMGRACLVTGRFKGLATVFAKMLRLRSGSN